MGYYVGLDVSVKTTAVCIVDSAGAVVREAALATELVSEALSEEGRMRYVGAVLGLAIGSLTKYDLDRRFVFRTQMV